MVCEKLRKYLDEKGVSYEVITHGEAFTAQEIAAALHVSGGMLVKVVVINSERGNIMAALPADRVVDIAKLRDHLGLRVAALARESDFKKLFPDCDVGAMPPFGHMYNMPVYVDESLTLDEYIVFQAGTHYEAIKMKYADYERLAGPYIMKATRKAA